MKSQAIVTLADSNYFDLLLELISSIKQFEQSKNISICVLDAGLKDDQIKKMAVKGGMIGIAALGYLWGLTPVAKLPSKLI